jgi:hypothetical protein
VRRRAAESGNTSYSEPVVIRSGTQTHFEVLPQYIRHNSGDDELSLKLMYWKRKLGSLRVGYPVDFTLNQQEVVELRDLINSALAVCEGGEDGDYVVVKIDPQETSVSESDVSAVSRTMALAVKNPTVLRVLSADQEGRALLGAVQLSARLVELVQAVEDLREALNTGEISERFYQEWCEAHSWAFGNAYAMRDDVRVIALGDQVDLLMKQTANGLRDIFELKRPDMRPLLYDSSHKCYYWSADASKAIGQCHRYIDAFHDYARGGLRDHRDVVGYHPRSFIVQGRSNDWNEDQVWALHGLNSRLHGVQLMTYDQLLAQAEKLIEMLTVEVERESEV